MIDIQQRLDALTFIISNHPRIAGQPLGFSALTLIDEVPSLGIDAQEIEDGLERLRKSGLIEETPGSKPVGTWPRYIHASGTKLTKKTEMMEAPWGTRDTLIDILFEPVDGGPLAIQQVRHRGARTSYQVIHLPSGGTPVYGLRGQGKREQLALARRLAEEPWMWEWTDRKKFTPEAFHKLMEIVGEFLKIA